MNEPTNNNQLAKVKSQEVSLQRKEWLTNLVQWTANPTDKSIILAAADKQFQYFTTSEDMTRLIAVVTKWRIMLGLSKDMTEDELKINCKFIKDSYPKGTIKDVEMAINMSLRGSLDVNPEPYGSFAPLYISRILNAYMAYSEQVINKMLEIKRREERRLANEPKKQSYEERIVSRRDYIIWWGTKVQHSNTYLADFDSIMWNFLTRNNLIKSDSALLADASEFADNEIVKENMDVSFKKIFDKMSLADKQEDTKKRREMYGRYFMMKKFFQQIIDVKKWLVPFDDSKLLGYSKNK